MYKYLSNNNILAEKEEYAGNSNCDSTATDRTAETMDQTQQQQQQQQESQLQQHVNLKGTQQQQPTNNIKNVRKNPYIRIIEQPASKSLRFRYECEGRSAGSIPGVNSTPENKTYPTIEIIGYKGRAVVVVSCITKDQPYRPHPHNLVGKEGCKKGVCTLEISPETMRAVFSNLGIQCVKKKDIDAALKVREEIRVDPFKTGFTHRFQPSNIDLNSVRLCFQVFLESDQKGRFTQPLAPVVSEPIFDKKAMSDLVICRVCSCSATVLGNTQIILLCEKVAKDDISVRFYEEINGQTIWESFGEFEHTDVHKQTAITFKTPRYRNIDIKEPAKVFLQLKRPSDGVTSEGLPFEYVPLDSGRQRFMDFRRNLKRKPDLDIFREILFIERKEKFCYKDSEIIDLYTQAVGRLPEPQFFPTQDKTLLTSTKDTTMKEEEKEPKRRSQQEIDLIIKEKIRKQHQQTSDRNACLHEADEILNGDQQNQGDKENQVFLMDTNERITEWMNLNKLLELNNPSFNESIETNSSTITANNQIVHNDSDDKTFSDLLEQVAELNGIFSDHIIRWDNYNSTLINEQNGIDSYSPETYGNLVESGQIAMQAEDSFDDAATYSSLQIAFKNPISIPICDMMSVTSPVSNLEVNFGIDQYNRIDVRPSQASLASPLTEPLVSTQKPDIFAQSEPAEPPNINSRLMNDTSAEEEKLPPLLPKRLRKQDSNAENRYVEANTESSLDCKSRQKTPIIIMKTPDQSARSKCLPQKSGISSALLKQKKSGFFSKIFSRHKSKSDLNEATDTTTSPPASRAPNLWDFYSNDCNRASMSTVQSLHPISLQNSTEKRVQKVGKQVGRSVSSVSGKRPDNLTGHVIHIPLKGESLNNLPQNEKYSRANTPTLSNTIDRKTVSALQLGDLSISERNMELVAIADRQSLRNLCEGEFNVQLDPNVDLTEAEHFALYTSIPPKATSSEFDETSAYYASVDAGEILTAAELAARLVAANNLN